MTQKIFFPKALALYAVVAAFILVSSGFANAQFVVTGKVISVNDVSKTITIEPSMKVPELGSGPYSFALTSTDPTDRDKTRLADIRGMANESKRLSDIKTGDWVTINYHQESTGQYAADGILVGVPASSKPHAGAAGTYPQYPATGAYHRTDTGAMLLTGKVIAIDKNAKTFTVDPSFANASAENRMLYTFALDRNGMLLWGNERRDFSDLNIGDMITVSYHQENTGKILADRIAVTPVGYVAPRPQASLYPERRVAMEPHGNVFSAGSPFAVTGRVVALDRDAKTLTVDSSYLKDAATFNKSAAGLSSFKLDENSTVVMGDKTMNFSDINVGDTVTVNYHQESNGNIIADGIAINPALAPLPEERG
jgi:hypothetical protein